MVRFPGIRNILQKPDPSQKNRDYLWDYMVHKIRKLEVTVNRGNSGNLSMMLEELPAIDEDKGFMMSRCIHLDTDEPYGTPFAEATLNHLDLAINVYFSDRMKERHEVEPLLRTING